MRTSRAGTAARCALKPSPPTHLADHVQTSSKTHLRQLTFCCHRAAPSRPTKLPVPVLVPVAIIATSTGTSTTMRAIAWIIFLGFMIQQFTVVVLVSTIPCPRIGVSIVLSILAASPSLPPCQPTGSPGAAVFGMPMPLAPLMATGDVGDPTTIV